MSYANYKKAMELSKQHYDFLRRGALEVNGNIFCANFDDAHYTSMDIIANLEMNKNNNLTVEDKFVPLLEEEEWINYLDYNKLTKDGEPTVVYAWPTSDEFIIFERTNQDLGDFLLELFEEIKYIEL